MTARVSIIVPVYNVEQYLDRCMKSLLNQSYQNIEIILVNDGSPDSSPSICDKYAYIHNDKIRVIHKENGGLSSARLAGFEIARGEYILFVDSDDYIANDMVEKMVYTMEKCNADLTICGYYTENNGIKIEKMLPYKEKIINGRQNICKDYILPLLGSNKGKINIPGFLCIRLLKKSLIQREFFGSERKYFLEDHVFDLLYADRVNKIAIVNEPLYYYCVNRASLSNCYRENKWEMYINLKQFYEEYVTTRDITNTDDRIEGYLYSAIFSSIDNAVLSGNYHKYQSILKQIAENKDAKVLITQHKRAGFSTMQQLILFFLRHRCYRLLYLIRKKRIYHTYKTSEE